MIFTARSQDEMQSWWLVTVWKRHGPNRKPYQRKKKYYVFIAVHYSISVLFFPAVNKQIRRNHVLKWPIELMPRHIEHMVTYATRFYIQKSNVCILFSIFDNCETWKESERLLLRIIFRLIVFFPHGSHSWMYDSGE